MGSTFVHPHALEHGLTEDKVLWAWSNFVRSQQRSTPSEDQCIRVGYGKTAPNAIQMIGIAKPYGSLIIHATTPPQAPILDELGIPRRHR